MYKKKNEQTSNRRDEEEKQKSSSFASIHEKKNKLFHTHTHTDIDIFTYKLFCFLINKHRLFQMYHAARCRYYAFHSHRDCYPFADHDHGHVNDVLKNLDDLVTNDDQNGVHSNANEFGLKIKEQRRMQSLISSKTIIEYIRRLCSRLRLRGRSAIHQK